MQWIIIIAVAIYGWNAGWFTSSDKHYNSGYNDGYAEGYNTQCRIRATFVKGDWDNKHYSRGYNDGRNEGINACMMDER